MGNYKNGRNQSFGESLPEPLEFFPLGSRATQKRT